MFNLLTNLVIASVIVQAIVQAIKKLYKFEKGYAYNKFNMKVFLAIIVSLIICIFGEIDLFELLEINMSVPFLGEILTGFIISLGSNSVRNLIKQFENIKSSTDASSPGTSQSK